VTRRRKVTIFLVIVILLVGGGLTAYFLTRDRGPNTLESQTQYFLHQLRHNTLFDQFDNELSMQVDGSRSWFATFDEGFNTMTFHFSIEGADNTLDFTISNLRGRRRSVHANLTASIRAEEESMQLTMYTTDRFIIIRSRLPQTVVNENEVASDRDNNVLVMKLYRPYYMPEDLY